MTWRNQSNNKCLGPSIAHSSVMYSIEAYYAVDPLEELQGHDTRINRSIDGIHKRIVTSRNYVPKHSIVVCTIAIGWLAYCKHLHVSPLQPRNWVVIVFVRTILSGIACRLCCFLVGERKKRPMHFISNAMASTRSKTKANLYRTCDNGGSDSKKKKKKNGCRYTSILFTAIRKSSFFFLERLGSRPPNIWIEAPVSWSRRDANASL